MGLWGPTGGSTPLPAPPSARRTPDPSPVLRSPASGAVGSGRPSPGRLFPSSGKIGELFQHHAVVRQDRHEAVPQLTRRPVVLVESGKLGHAPERSADVCRVQLRAVVE